VLSGLAREEVCGITQKLVLGTVSIDPNKLRKCSMGFRAQVSASQCS